MNGIKMKDMYNTVEFADILTLMLSKVWLIYMTCVRLSYTLFGDVNHVNNLLLYLNNSSMYSLQCGIETPT